MDRRTLPVALHSWLTRSVKMPSYRSKCLVYQMLRVQNGRLPAFYSACTFMLPYKKNPGVAPAEIATNYSCWRRIVTVSKYWCTFCFCIKCIPGNMLSSEGFQRVWKIPKDVWNWIRPNFEKNQGSSKYFKIKVALLAVTASFGYISLTLL